MSATIEKAFKCQQCPAKFAIAQQLHAHRLVHTDERPHKCHTCGKQFKVVYHLKKHMTNIHVPNRARPFQCSICQKTFFTQGALNRHTSSHGPKLECAFCSSKFTTKGRRDDHIVSAHTLEKGWTCEKCPAKFATGGLLREHRFVHIEEGRLSCHLCSNKFKLKSNLNRHVKTVHVSGRPRNFECSICNKAYYTKYELNNHTLTHSRTGDKFPCYFCKQMFYTHTRLVGHMRIHTQEKPFPCPVASCQYSTSYSSNLISHRKRNHSPADEKRPRSKTWSCYFCHKVFATMYSLENHFLRHILESPFYCGLCQRRFYTPGKLRCHINSHTNEKPFSCVECRKCFNAKGNLQQHMAVHRKEQG